MKSKQQMVEALRTMLSDVFVAREAGSRHPRMARSRGYVDGYMRALLETGVVSNEELLRIVAQQRTAVSGPPTRTLELAPLAHAV